VRPAEPVTPAFLGPALGRHEGWVTTQGEVLAGLFATEGHPVLVSSDRIHPLARGAAHAVDLVRWRRTADVAVVSVFSGRAFALAVESVATARALGISTVAWLHGGNLPELGAAHPRWARRLLTGVDAVVAPSTFLARWADSIRPGTEVIPNVLDLGAYEFRPRRRLRPRLLWMRTFQELYDPALAVRALGVLRELGVDASLTMAGQDKGLLAPTRDLVHALDLQDSVRFPGFASGSTKLALFADHDVFLNTNRVDNAPVTVLEAAASGLVVVSTAAGGIPDLLPDGEAAVLIAPDDAGAMASAVATLLAEPATAAALAEAARVIAARSGWPNVRDRWLHLFDRLNPRAAPD
jgi:glycosyltransferase involved in cell wall biosynthesis